MNMNAAPTPSGVVRQAIRVVAAGVHAVASVEQQANAVLRSSIERGGDHASPSNPRSNRDQKPDGDDDLAASMQDLLNRAIQSGSGASRTELFRKMLDQIVPDEARIVSALADGSSATLLSVHARNRAGLVGAVVLENMSLIGRTANLGLPHLTPTYVSHLLALGILEAGPEDPDLKTQYEVLTAEIAILEAIKRAGRGPLPARVTRGTVRLSGLGLELCAATGLACE